MREMSVFFFSFLQYYWVCFSFYFFFIELKLPYSVVLVSAVQQNESAPCIHIYLPFRTSLPLIPHPPPIQVTAEHQAEFPALYISFLLAICFTHASVHMSVPVSQFIPSPAPAHVHPSIFLCLRLYSCPVDRFICTIFLDSMCTC